jgi:hypothetical protein
MPFSGFKGLRTTGCDNGFTYHQTLQVWPDHGDNRSTSAMAAQSAQTARNDKITDETRDSNKRKRAPGGLIYLW